jgi:methionyl-tRNA formyltransferase
MDIFPHWSWIIPKEIHGNFPCIIFRMTDLPYGRGGSPLQNLIIRGHDRTMLSAIKCVSELDAGPIYQKVPLELNGSAEEILTRGSVLMGEMIVYIVTNRPVPTPQKGEVVGFKR